MEFYRPRMLPKEGVMGMHPSPTQLPAATLSEGPEEDEGS